MLYQSPIQLLTPHELTIKINYHRRPKWKHGTHADKITFKGRCNRIPNKYRDEVRGNRTKSDLWVNLSKRESSVLFAWIAEARGGREGEACQGRVTR